MCSCIEAYFVEHHHLSLGATQPPARAQLQARLPVPSPSAQAHAAMVWQGRSTALRQAPSAVAVAVSAGLCAARDLAGGQAVALLRQAHPAVAAVVPPSMVISPNMAAVRP